MTRTKCYQLKDAIKLTGRSKTTLLRWAFERKIPEGERDFRGWRYYTKSDLDEIIRFAATQKNYVVREDSEISQPSPRIDHVPTSDSFSATEPAALSPYSYDSNYARLLRLKIPPPYTHGRSLFEICGRVAGVAVLVVGVYVAYGSIEKNREWLQASLYHGKAEIQQKLTTSLVNFRNLAELNLSGNMASIFGGADSLGSLPGSSSKKTALLPEFASSKADVRYDLALTEESPREIVREVVVREVTTGLVNTVALEEVESLKANFAVYDQRLNKAYIDISAVAARSDPGPVFQNVYKTITLTQKIDNLDSIDIDNGAVVRSGSLVISGGGVDATGTVKAGEFRSTGNTVLGDAGGDTLTVNASTVAYTNSSTTTIPNNVVNAWSLATSTSVTPILSMDTTNGGRVGIGTTSPATTLSVQGNALISGNLTVANITATGTTLTLSGLPVNSLLSTNASGVLTATSTPTFGNFNATSTVATSTISTGGLAVGGSQFVVQQTSGNVGIGTSTPNWLLQAAGTRPSLALSDSSAGANLKHWLFSSMGGNLYMGTSTDAYGTSTPAALAVTNAGDLTPGRNITVATDTASSIGSKDLRFNEIYSKYVRVGNPSDSHTNVLLKVGSGETTRPDFPSIGTGSGFTAVYGTHHAPVFKWTGDSNGAVFALKLLPSLMSDATPRAVADFTVLDMQMPESINTLASLANSYGLVINYSKPAGVTNAVPLKITGGTTSIASIDVGGQANSSTLTISDSAVSNVPITMSLIAAGVLALKDPSANAQELRVYASGTAYTEYKNASVTVRDGAALVLGDSAGRYWSIAGSTGNLVPDSGRDIGTTAVPFGVAYGTTFKSFVAGQTQPKGELGAGYLYLGPGGSTAADVRFTRTGTAAVSLDSDGSGGAVTLALAGTLTATSKIGIGTTTPNWLLQAAGTRPSLALSDSSAGANLKHWLFASQGGNLYIATSSDAYATSTTPMLTILSTGLVGIGTSSPSSQLSIEGRCVDTGSGCADIAERYPASEPLVPGEIVAADPDTPKSVKKAAPGDAVLGIVSTSPAISIEGSSLQFLSGSFYQSSPLKPNIALAGRVPVRVNLEGGEIKVGDRIMLSSSAGIGTKATTSGMTVGIALEPFDGWETLPDGANVQKEEGEVLVFVNLGYAALDAGTSQLAASDMVQATSNGWSVDQTTGKVSVNFFGDINANGNKIINVAEIVSQHGLWRLDDAGRLIAERVEVKELTVKGKTTFGSMEKPVGITLFDPSGFPYCVKVGVGGALISLSGACGAEETIPVSQSLDESAPSSEVSTTTLATSELQSQGVESSETASSTSLTTEAITPAATFTAASEESPFASPPTGASSTESTASTTPAVP